MHQVIIQLHASLWIEAQGNVPRGIPVACVALDRDTRQRIK